jgi:hypothetical protein
MRPSVRIDPHPPFSLGQPVTYHATASDPDGDSLQPLQWVRVPGQCQGGDGPSGGWSQSSDFTVASMYTTSAFCVFVKATDGYGASAVDYVEGDPQDNPPIAVLELVSPPEASSFEAGTPFVLSAEKSSDPDPGDAVQIQWFVKAGPPSFTSLPECPGTAPQLRRCFIATDPGDYQIEIRVTDNEAQTSTADKWLHVRPGQLGTPAIDLVSPAGSGPYPLGSLFQVTGQNSDGVDLGYDWEIVPPPGSDPMSGPCNDPSSQCFTADIPGTYRVGLSVRNDAGPSPIVWATFVVAPDQPPCIDHTTPDFTPAMTVLTADTDFVVDLVSDDLDPFPPTTDMQWWESDNGGDFHLVENGFPSFPLHHASYEPGVQVRLRVEVRDRDTTRAEEGFIACHDADFCSEPSLIHPSACFQRVTWTVVVR